MSKIIARSFSRTAFSIFMAVAAICSHAKATSSGNMKVHVLRMTAGEDPRTKLESFVAEKKMNAAIVLSAVGSLTTATFRYANQSKTETLTGHFEIVSLSGTLSVLGGSHLHMSVSDEKGKTVGGHLTEGSKVYTTLEIAIGEISDVQFTREVDPVTTYKELKITPNKK